MADDISKAASELGKRSAAARKEKWGEETFKARMKKWGKTGGRPKGSGKKQTKKTKETKKGGK
jgi:hypothetical protein